MEQQVKGKMETNSALPVHYLIFLGVAYAVTGILLLILAGMLYRFQLSNKAVRVGIVLIYLVSTFLAGFLAGKKAKRRKYLWGLLMGAGYFLILALMSLLLHGTGEGLGFVTPLLLCLGGGTLGGMVS